MALPHSQTGPGRQVAWQTLRGRADPRCFHIPSAPRYAGPISSAAQTWYRLFSPCLYDPRKWTRKKAFSPASPPPAPPAPRCALPTAGSSARPATASAGALLVVQGTRRNLEKPGSAHQQRFAHVHPSLAPSVAACKGALLLAPLAPALRAARRRQRVPLRPPGGD